MHGEELGGYAYGMWTVVVFNTLLILFFVISYMVPKKNIEWCSMVLNNELLVDIRLSFFAF